MLKRIKLFIFTVARSDHGILTNLIDKISKDKRFRVYLIKGPAHDSKIFGMTRKEIKKNKKIDVLNYNFKYGKSDQLSILSYMSNFIKYNSRFINKIKPDGALILGDRYEMFANAITCFNLKIPIFHFCGGSKTAGSLDDIYRNCISLMSDIHLVETSDHKKNLEKLGIKKNLYVIGSPSLENFKSQITAFSKVIKKFHLDINSNNKIIICTFHPETTSTLNQNLKYLSVLLNFLLSLNQNIILTYPNADQGFKNYINLIKNKTKNKKHFFVIKNLGKKNYFTILKNSDLMIGNSSSGIIETGSFKLPTINVGIRQKDRFRNKNVIDAKFKKKDLTKAYKKATSNNFKSSLQKLNNIYEMKNTASNSIRIIHKVLKTRV